ncbi:MFS transporter [Paracoccus caeni]|uniref:MFS transporter n=1 Tax=Paracoccus caeni TaxID=657651 RepID=A0A934VZ08_9RHOB|nr:MFS transporter [Paracoccus caeni]MBK4216557.1 MFS transporter [Paracoccus caeni]
MAFYAFYFTLYAQIAIGITFIPMWLRAQGLSETDIGTCLALAAFVAVIINPVVGLIADRTHQNKAILTGLVLCATVSVLVLGASSGPLWVAVVFLVYRSIVSPLVPLAESILIANLSAYRLSFGTVRAWGSASVVVTTLLCGFLVDWSDTGAILYLLIVILLAQIGTSTGLPSRAGGIRPAITTASILRALRNRGFLLLLGSAAISQACHGVFYAYSTFRWLEAGHSTSAIGIFWGIGVSAEIVAFACGGRITARLSPGKIIAIACCAGVLRWGIFGLSAELMPTLFVQILQGATLGLTQIGVAAYLQRNIAPQFLSSASGTYWAFSGLAAAVAIFVGARLYPISSSHVFLFSALLCGFATIVASMLTRYERGHSHGKAA